jgi:hypothetical protein
VKDTIKIDGIRSEDVRTELGIYSQKEIYKWERHLWRMDGSCIPKQTITCIV